MDLLIVPENCTKLSRVTFPHPKDNRPLQYFYDEENLALYEVLKYSDQYRSWFIENLFCKEGHFNMLTKVDPLFIFLPHLIKYASEQFRTIHDICSSFSSSADKGFDRLDYALAPEINWKLVCDTQEIDDELFVRFNKSKTLTWLLKKHQITSETLKKHLSKQASAATLISHASDLIDQYLPSSISVEFKEQAKSCKIICNGVPEKIPVPNSNEKTDTKKPKIQQKPTSNKPSSSIPKNSIARFFTVKK